MRVLTCSCSPDSRNTVWYRVRICLSSDKMAFLERRSWTWHLWSEMNRHALRSCGRKQRERESRAHTPAREAADEIL